MHSGMSGVKIKLTYMPFVYNYLFQYQPFLRNKNSIGTLSEVELRREPIRIGVIIIIIIIMFEKGV